MLFFQGIVEASPEDEDGVGRLNLTAGPTSLLHSAPSKELQKSVTKQLNIGKTMHVCIVASYLAFMAMVTPLFAVNTSVFIHLHVPLITMM